jgi:hypothetical protein
MTFKTELSEIGYKDRSGKEWLRIVFLVSSVILLVLLLKKLKA